MDYITEIKKLVKPLLLAKSIFEKKMRLAEERLVLAVKLLEGKPVAFGKHEQTLFENRGEFDEFVRNVLGGANSNFDPTHVYSYAAWSDCYRCKDQRWILFPPSVKLLIVYIQFAEGVENPCVIDLGAV